MRAPTISHLRASVSHRDAKQRRANSRGNVGGLTTTQGVRSATRMARRTWTLDRVVSQVGLNAKKVPPKKCHQKVQKNAI